MPRLRHAAVCAVLLAAFGTAGMVFVTLPLIESPKGHQSLRSSVEGTALRTMDSAALPSRSENSEEPTLHGMCWVGAGMLAGIILAVSSTPAALAVTSPALQDGPWTGPGGFSIKKARHLELCKDNKKFHKRYKDQYYKKTQRQKKYAEGSAIWNRYTQKIASIERRERVYGDRFCGKADGLPRVIATGEPGIKGGVITPGLMFLYTAGWIGWAGRSYLVRTQDVKKEINIDAPLALTCMASGFAWPVAAWQEIVNGEMVVPDSEIYRGIH